MKIVSRRDAETQREQKQVLNGFLGASVPRCLGVSVVKRFLSVPTEFINTLASWLFVAPILTTRPLAVLIPQSC